MTATVEESPPTPAEQLAAAEEEAEREIAALIAGLVAAGVSAAAILALLAAFTGVVSAGAQVGWSIDARLALASASGRRTRWGAFRVEALPTSVADDVLAVVTDGARRIEEADDQQAELTRFERRMVRLATTKIHQAASAATFSYAAWLGMDLEWVTRRDGNACVVCTAMNGRRVAAGERFTPPSGRGMPRTLWAGFQGLPPAHPHCRCRPVPRPPRTQQGQP